MEAARRIFAQTTDSSARLEAIYDEVQAVRGEVQEVNTRLDQVDGRLDRLEEKANELLRILKS